MFREEGQATLYPWKENVVTRRGLFRDVTEPRLSYMFTSGQKREPVRARFDETTFQVLVKDQMHHPQSLASDGARTWWIFRDKFYVEDEGLDSDDVEALAMAKTRQVERRLEHARALRDAQTAVTPRESIPSTVKAEVWARYEGCCAECGSRERIEFDHIVPLALGGSNTARNLQILCEVCNRSKGAQI